METVGIIGTGAMGWRMGRLLAKAGYAVVGYDKAPEALKQAEAAGVAPAAGIADVARQADVVVTCVTDGADLEDVVAGPGGLLESLNSGKAVIDTTSAEPWISRELAPRLAAKGVAFLDAPMSGGVPAAEDGRLNFMVGGEAPVVDRWRPLLECMGPVIHHVGPVAAGHTMKAINMLAMAGTMLATAEVLAVGQEVGVPPQAFLDVLNQSSGGSYVTRVHFPRFILPGNYASGFTFDLMLKDLGIAIELAERLELTLFMGRRVWDLYRVAARAGYAGKDNTRIVDLIFEPKPTDSFAQEDTRAPPDAGGGDRIGVIGLGAMGSRMTARLLEKGVKPVVFDVDTAALEAAADRGASAAGSAAEVAAASDIIVLSLPDAPIIDRVFFGERGILEGIGERTPAPLLLDTSSSKAETTQRIGASLRALGGDMLDVPVSRGQPAAERGELSIMIGGAPATLERCRWVLEMLGTDLIHVAGLGTGHATKGLHNTVNAANVVIGGEALLMGAKAGLDPKTVAQVLCAGSGGSEVLAKRYIPYVLSGTFDSHFRMALMCKDASYGLELAAQTRTPALLCATALQLYMAALRKLGADADNTELIKLLAPWVGATLPTVPG